MSEELKAIAAELKEKERLRGTVEALTAEVNRLGLEVARFRGALLVIDYIEKDTDGKIAVEGTHEDALIKCGQIARQALQPAAPPAEVNHE